MPKAAHRQYSLYPGLSTPGMRLNRWRKKKFKSNGNRTEWSSIRSVILQTKKFLKCDWLRPVVFPRKEEYQGMKREICIKRFYTVSMLIETKDVIG